MHANDAEKKIAVLRALNVSAKYTELRQEFSQEEVVQILIVMVNDPANT